MARFIVEQDFKIIFKTLLGRDFEDKNSPAEIYVFVYTIRKTLLFVFVCYFHLFKTFDSFLNIVSQLRR